MSKQSTHWEVHVLMPGKHWYDYAGTNEDEAYACANKWEKEKETQQVTIWKDGTLWETRSK